MRLINRSAVFGAALFLCLTGCPAPNGNNPPRDLTPTEQAAVTDAVSGLVAAARFGGTLAPLQADELNLDTLQLFAQFGECPQVTVLATAAAAAIRLDYRDGCGGPATAGATIRGAVDLTVDRVARSANAALSNLFIGGVPYTGTAGFTVTRGANRTLGLSGVLNLTISGVGSLSGVLTIEIDANGVLTLSANALTLSDANGVTYSLALNDVRIDPAGNGSFMPASGTVVVSGAGVELVITFGLRSPTGGTVAVQVGEFPATDFTVPGF